MKTTPTLLTAAALSAGLFLATSNANANLIDQGMTVYDTGLGISWLKNANLAAIDNFGVGGIALGGTMNWYTAQRWIGAMNSANYLGYSDWRQPATLQPDASCGSQIGGVSYGYNCTGSEMGNLFYNGLGVTAYASIAGAHNANYSLFSNLQSDVYWSGTEYAPNTNNAWYFDFNSGFQYAALKGYNYLRGIDTAFYALAVRPGQAGATTPVPTVPEPGTLLLMGAGLAGLAARRRLALR